MLKRLGPVLLAAALLLAGCGTDKVAEEDKILIPSKSRPLGPASAGKDERPTPKPKKHQAPRRAVISGRTTGVRLTLPAGWNVLSDSEVRFNASGPRAEEIAGQLGMSVEQVRTALRQMDALAIGFAGSLNLTRPGVGGTLPSEAYLRSSLGAVGPVTEVRDVRTPLGAGRVVSYRIEEGGGTAHGAALFVVVNGAVVQLTVTTADPGQTRDVLDTVIPTLART